jgi:cytochrome c peroxidase
MSAPGPKVERDAVTLDAGEDGAALYVPRAGEIIDGKYRIERTLGRGGMGVVFAAEHVATLQRVAVKILQTRGGETPASLARFQREIMLTAAIASERVVRVTDAGVVAGTPYMVMERLEGADLGSVLRERGSLPVEEAVDHALDACAALARAHAQGIVHRDIKPSNLFLARAVSGVPIVKVLDFGLSKKQVLGGNEADSLTGTGQLLGSLPYMAPEQLRNAAAAPTDIWALGATLYHCLAGRRPFQGDTAADLILAIIESAPESLRSVRPEIPAALEAAVLACLQKDPQQRPASMEALALLLEPFGTERGRAAVQEILGTGAPSSSATRSIRPPPASVPSAERCAPATQVSAPQPQPPPPRKRKALAIAGILFAIAAVVAVVTLVALQRRTSATTSTTIDAERLQSFAPLAPAPLPADAAQREKIELGRRLFADTRLSGRNDVACVTCHDLARHGADGRARSKGTGGVVPPRNTPSVLGAADFFALNWDGRYSSLEQHALGVLHNPSVMGISDETLGERIHMNPAYEEAFERAYPGQAAPVTANHVAEVIAAYERTLVAPGRWDRFLAGDANALSEDARRGFNRFVEVGCVACHFGPHAGATMYQKLGLVKAWPRTDDLGRYEVTHKEADRQMFRVPSLRNVQQTAPYLHDGSVGTLEEMVRLMARHQIGKELDAEDVRLIVRWLETLTGELSPR